MDIVERKLILGKLPEEARIRYGDKSQSEERLASLADELKALAASISGSLAKALENGAAH